jgi:chromosome segregation ATPase
MDELERLVAENEKLSDQLADANYAIDANDKKIADLRENIRELKGEIDDLLDDMNEINIAYHAITEALQIVRDHLH